MVRFMSAAGAAVGLLIAMAAPAAADGNTVPVRVNPTLTPVAGAYAEVDRSAAKVTLDVHDTGLAPSTTYHELWVIFNNPDACKNPTPASRCDPGSADAGNPATGFSVILGSGSFTTDASGNADYEASLSRGDMVLVGRGLVNGRHAEIAFLPGPHAPRGPFTQIILSDPTHGDGAEGD